MAEYCPACSGHGTNVHECTELRSAVVRVEDVLELMRCYVQGDTLDHAIFTRLADAIDGELEPDHSQDTRVDL